MKKKLVVAVAAGLAAAALFVLGGCSRRSCGNVVRRPLQDWHRRLGSAWVDAHHGQRCRHGGRRVAYSYFGGTTRPASGNRVAWPTHGYIAQLDVYLDPASMDVGDGFDLSVASSTKDGAYGRDFIFHVGMTASGELRVAGSNNSGFAVNDSVLAGGVEIETAGWYTFQHEFYDNGDGTLAVDLNVINEDGVQVFNTTRNTAADTIAEAGGPWYQWFTFIDGTIQFDNQLLERRGSDITLRPVAGRYSSPTKHPNLERSLVAGTPRRRTRTQTAATRWPSLSRRPPTVRGAHGRRRPGSASRRPAHLQLRRPDGLRGRRVTTHEPALGQRR